MELGGTVVVAPSTAELKRLYTFLDSSDGRLQRAAAILLARMGDDECCQRLAQLLDNEDELTAATAHTSLKSITGQSFDAVRDQWLHWLEQENAWLVDGFAKAEESIATGLPENVLAGAAAMVEHRLYRHRAARALEPAFTHDDPTVQKIACDMAAKLGSPFAVPSLIALLENEDESVRTQAWSALKSITGQDLPLDVKRWQDALGL
jgi:HEAT repeat protein